MKDPTKLLLALALVPWLVFCAAAEIFLVYVYVSGKI